MKRTLQGIAVALVLLLGSCKDAPKADEAQTTVAQDVENDATAAPRYSVDLQKSSVQWIGTKPSGRHRGTVKLKEGSLNVKDGNVLNGRFVLDLNTIMVQDEDQATTTKLQTHLKSADFFEVDKYGTAVFEITGVQPGVTISDKDLVMKDATHTITGNLKLKEITKSITFPAKITTPDGMIYADADFNIDRTQWGINYKSDRALGDKIINSDINIKVHLEAGK